MNIYIYYTINVNSIYIYIFVLSKGFAPPPPCPPGMRMLLDARPLREGCLFVAALKEATGVPKGGGGISSKNKKDYIFKNVHPSRAPGPFWPNRDADRTLITTVSCVVRRGLKSGRRGPKGRARIFKKRETRPF